MNPVHFFLLAATLSLSMTVHARTSTRDISANSASLTYTVENGKATVINCNREAAGHLVIPARLGGAPVAEIGESAFFATKVASVTVPETVRRIGHGAFGRCLWLRTIDLPEALEAIGHHAFAAARLTHIKIPENVRSIGSGAFTGCSLLEDVKLGSGLARIGSRAFSGCDSLTRIEIPKSVTSIGDRAFGSCDSLAAIEISPANAEYTSQNGVLYNKAMTALIACPDSRDGTLTIPDGITHVNEYAFFTCNSLKSIRIPEDTVHIDLHAFPISPVFHAIEVDANNEVYKSEGGVLYNAAMIELVKFPSGKKGPFSIPSTVNTIHERAFAYCESLNRLSIPEGVTHIEDSTFRYCTALRKITLPDGVVGIGRGAFQGCASLETVDFSENLQRIGEGAFAYCDSLERVAFGGEITTIEDRAFSHCASLNDASFGGDAPTEFGDNVFRKTSPSFTISFQKGSDGFSTPRWQGYRSITIPEDEGRGGT